MTEPTIVLRGVAVHNLRHVDLDIPRRKLVVVCGVSGSGKSSLALDTLYAEGQRRYIETFSTQARQFLEQWEKPAADRIDGIPPAVAVTRANPRHFHSRATVGTATEIHEYLTLLWARLGDLHCPRCGHAVRRHSPASAAEALGRLPSGRTLVAYPPPATSSADGPQALAELRAAGFARLVVQGQLRRLDDLHDELPASALVVVDRLDATAPPTRLIEALETAFARGSGRAVAFVEAVVESNSSKEGEASMEGASFRRPNQHTCHAATGCASHSDRVANGNRVACPVTIDGRDWLRFLFSQHLECAECGIPLASPEPRQFSFDSPLGACPTCEGSGSAFDYDLDLIVPDKTKSLRDGALAPFASKTYARELQSLLAFAEEARIPVDVPFGELSTEHVRMILDGVPEREFGGLRGFFARLEAQKFKMHLRAYLKRWQSSRPCPACHGARLRPESLAVTVAGRNIADVLSLRINQSLALFRALPVAAQQQAIARTVLEQVVARLAFLDAVGLAYLSLDRPLRTLSGGEAQRVALTTALGSSLVNMLYVLDEPTAGLHPHDIDQIVEVVRQLRDRGNSVVVVEHDECVLRAADHLIEIGPAAGERGGRVVYQGPPADIVAASGSVTGDFLAGRRGANVPQRRRPKNRGVIRLVGARGHNLKNVTVEFPLAMLCAITGVSGSGKSTLVEDTLYPALCRRKRQPSDAPAPYDDVFGDGQIDDVVLIDQSPIGRSPRSNPVTFVKAFDEIRQVFAETLEARTHNFTAGHFSFNVDGGRCTACEGDGSRQIDMQFLADVFVKCPVCQGTRYRPEILQAKHRGRNIAEVLDMTVREAFLFFRGQVKVQQRLKQLMDVGLDYVRLGQAANTLSGGESQRLKLAVHLATTRRHRTLFILDEPTTGLHPADVAQLLDCFTALLDTGHSLVVVEHNLQVLKAADWIIDLGPGAADEGGQVVATGTPEEIAANPASLTGRYLQFHISATPGSP